jgi:hypothetical protein
MRFPAEHLCEDHGPRRHGDTEMSSYVVSGFSRTSRDVGYGFTPRQARHEGQPPYGDMEECHSQ